MASQQGKYLGRKLSKLAKQHKVLTANEIYDDDDATYDKPFSYLHLGSLAYIGNAVSAITLRFFVRDLTRSCLRWNCASGIGGFRFPRHVIDGWVGGNVCLALDLLE